MIRETVNEIKIILKPLQSPHMGIKGAGRMGLNKPGSREHGAEK